MLTTSTMKLLLPVLCATLVFVQAKHSIKARGDEKLLIEILYESLCPDSIRFIMRQLNPTYEKIAKYVKILFVPFGKSVSTPNGFQCQHGPDECIGNIIQSCVLDNLPQQQQQVQYVNCFMSSFYRNPREYGKVCAQQLGVNWTIIKQCVNTNRGRQLQLAAENITNLYNPSSIPTIVYNSIFDQDAQDSSMYGFYAYVCSRISDAHPDACPVIELI